MKLQWKKSLCILFFCFNYQRAFVACKNEQLKQKTATQEHFKNAMQLLSFFYRCTFEFVADLCYEISVLDSSTIIFILYPLTCNYEFHVSFISFLVLLYSYNKKINGNAWMNAYETREEDEIWNCRISLISWA